MTLPRAIVSFDMASCALAIDFYPSRPTWRRGATDRAVSERFARIVRRHANDSWTENPASHMREPPPDVMTPKRLEAEFDHELWLMVEEGVVLV